MHVPFRPLFVASAIALSVSALGTAHGDEKSVQSLADARHESRIMTTYALSPYLRANDLQVSVYDGKATLTGVVEESVAKDLAKEIALGVKGVKEVDNQIVVQPDYVPPVLSATRSYGELIDDATITAAVKSKLMWSKHTDGLSTEVETNGGKVTLRGKAESAAARALAGRLAMNTRGVGAVDNQLSVKSKPNMADTAKGSVKAAGQDLSDSWITAKVKSTLLYSTNVNSIDISVSTKQGVVTLSGKVGSGAEQALAIELAHNVRGVKSVQSQALSF